MSNEHPKMLFRAGTQIKWDGLLWDFLVVESKDEEDTARADGWLTAAQVGEEVTKPRDPYPEPEKAPEAPADDAPPTRDELERKAKELGIKFDGRWGDKRLADAIAALIPKD